MLMESTIEYLQLELKAAGPSAWEGIAAEISKQTGRRVTFHSLRQIAYGQRPNLGSVKRDALTAYFKRKAEA